MAEIIELGVDEDESDDIVLADNASITISLFGADENSVPQGCQAYIQQKMSNGTYLNRDAIDTNTPSKVLQANGTWRVKKLASTIACGVDGD